RSCILPVSAPRCHCWSFPWHRGTRSRSRSRRPCCPAWARWWVKGGLPVPGDLDPGFPEGGAHRFGAIPVAGIGIGTTLVLAIVQMAVELPFKHFFNTALLQFL